MDIKQALRRMKHGGDIHRLTLGDLPAAMGRVLHPAKKYRIDLEQLVLEVKGEVSLADAHWIDEAATAEIHVGICRWLLRERFDKLTAGDIARCSAEIMKAKGVRNKAFERLGVDKLQQNTIKALYSTVDSTPDTPPTSPPQATETDTPVNPSPTSDVAANTRQGVWENPDDEPSFKPEGDENDNA